MIGNGRSPVKTRLESSVRFKLLRYFSIASAVAILALAAAFLSFYGRSAETQLVSTVEHDNIVLATAMANEIVGAFPNGEP